MIISLSILISYAIPYVVCDLSGLWCENLCISVLWYPSFFKIYRPSLDPLISLTYWRRREKCRWQRDSCPLLYVQKIVRKMSKSPRKNSNSLSSTSLPSNVIRFPAIYRIREGGLVLNPQDESEVSHGWLLRTKPRPYFARSSETPPKKTST